MSIPESMKGTHLSKKEKIMGKITACIPVLPDPVLAFVCLRIRPALSIKLLLSSQSQQTIKGWGVFPAKPMGLPEDILKSPAICVFCIKNWA